MKVRERERSAFPSLPRRGRLLPPVGAIACSLIATGPAFGQFTDVTGAAGITHTHFDADPAIEYTDKQLMTGGAAAGDFDGDGWVDLYVTRYDAPDILYRNQGDGTFADVTDAVFGDAMPTANTNGAAWGDLNNNGHKDLVVSGTDHRHFLFMNDGQGGFTEVGGPRGVALQTNGVRNGQSVALADFDRDGYLDIAIGEWRQGTDTQPALRLLRNQGSAQPGHFEEVGSIVGVSGNASVFTPAFTDLDRDGHADLLAVSDFGNTRLFWANGDGTFTDGTDDAAINTGRNDMGAAIGDIDQDGDLDVFISNIGGIRAPNGNRLFRNEGGRDFTDITDAADVRDGDWGWGATFLDHDNDGDLDLAQVNGFRFDVIGPTDDPTRLWENDGTGTFTEVADQLGLNDTGQGRGLLRFDFDRDGDLDLFVVNNFDQPILYRNDNASGNDWLQVELRSPSGDAGEVGAFITITPDLTDPDAQQVRELTGGGQFLAQSEMLAHFGLGDFAGDSIDRIEIDWPGGDTQVLQDLPINRRWVITEGLTELLAGDMNGDGAIDGLDIDPFVAMLTGDVAPHALGDVNGDGVMDGLDIDPFVSGLTGQAGAATIPEPGTFTLIVFTAVLCRRRVGPSGRW